MIGRDACELSSVGQDARRRLVDLEDVRQRLALDALDNDTAAEELHDVESQLTACRDELARLDLARSELSRREIAAAEDAKREDRKRKLVAADKIAARLPSAARAVDKAATHLARAIAAHRKLADADLALRVEAGTVTEAPGWQPKPPYEGSLRHFLAAEGCSDLMDFTDRPGALRGGIGPLAGR